MLTALIALVLSASPARADVLDELIERSKAVHAFSATYRMTMTNGSPPVELRIDYQGPDKVRVDRADGSVSTSSWCVGGVLALRAEDPQQPMHARVDCGVVYAALEPIESALGAAFPAAQRHSGHMQTVANMRWSFDTKEQKANFNIEGALVDDASTPFGWLAELRRKGVAPVEDGDLLRYETDGAFKVALSRSSGFVQALDGKSPKGEMHLVLASLAVDAPIEAARFALPEGGAGADVSAELRRNVNRMAEGALRRRIWLALASDPAGAPWDDAARARREPIVRAFAERTVLATLERFLEDAAKKRDGVTERLKSLRAQGKSLEELEALRQKEIGFLTKRLDELEQGFGERIVAPAEQATLPRAAELLAFERELVLDVFRTKVRAPLLEEFERVSKAALAE